MKTDAIHLGQVFRFEVVVEASMQAQFGDVLVHPLYSTASMLNHMEWASRQHLLPALEHGEEGFGYQMVIQHMAPVPIGERVEVVAEVTGILPNRLICQCHAYSQYRKIGQAKIVQAVLPLDKLHARISSS